jgi:hypothetical protein
VSESSVASESFVADPELLGMQRHPEGGWYRETWRHDLNTVTPRGERPLATCVSFLLLPGERSAWHRVASAELWLWQGGGPVRLTLGGTGDAPATGSNGALGTSYELGAGGQYLVKPDAWQTAEPATHRAVLVACVVSPGFVFDDFSLAEQG